MGLSQEPNQVSSGSGGVWKVRFLPYPRKTLSFPRCRWTPRSNGPAWLEWLPSPRIVWEKREMRGAEVDATALSENLEMLLNALQNEGFGVREILTISSRRENGRHQAGPRWQTPPGVDGILIVAQQLVPTHAELPGRSAESAQTTHSGSKQ